MQFRKLLIGCALAAFAAAPAWGQGGMLTVGLKAEPSSIDPHYHNLGPNNSMAAHYFSRLVEQDERLRLLPGLAVSWKPVGDTTWEFKLREGVKFHDGSDFNADDVMFTIERAPNVPKSPSSFGTYLKGKTFTKIDDFTIQVSTERPYPLMPVDMAQVPIISADVGADVTTADFNSGKAAIGTGPFRFVEWVPGDRLVVERNEDYFDAKPEWQKIVFKPIKSGPARVAALLAGDVDFIDNIPPIDIPRLKGDENVQLSQGVSSRVIYLHMDQYRENSPFVKANGGGDIKNPLLDVRVRKAISKALNRDAIVDRVMEGVAIKAGQLLPEGFFGVTPNLKPEPYDPEGAKALLAEAGYPDGFELTIHGPNDRYINDAKICEAVAQMLTRAGIKTSVETMPKAVYFRRASRGGADGSPEFSFILVGWGSGTGESSSPLRSLIHSYDKDRGFGASNRGRHSDAEIDTLIEDALATVDDDARLKLLQEATELAIGRNQGIIPTHYQVNTWAGKKGLSYTARADERTIAMGVTSDK